MKDLSKDISFCPKTETTTRERSTSSVKVSVYFTVLGSELDTSLWSSLLNELPRALHDGITRYRFWQDRHRALFGKLLLGRALEDLGHSKARLASLQYTGYGRPGLEGGIEFNISHSGDYVVCAISDQCRLGIDVELMQNIDLQDFSTVMTKSQWDHINTSNTPLREFCRLWTLKESVIKANGKGLSVPLNELETDHNTVIAEGIKWYLTEFFFDENYSAHLACNVPGIQLELKYVNF